MAGSRRNCKIHAMNYWKPSNRILLWPGDCTKLFYLHNDKYSVCHYHMLIRDVIFCVVKNTELDRSAIGLSALYDESYFSPTCNSACITYRENGEHETIYPTLSKGTCFLLSGSMLGRYTDLHIFQGGSFLSPSLLKGAMCAWFLFMSRNATSYYTVTVAELLECDDIHSMNSPARTPRPKYVRTHVGYSRDVWQQVSSHQ